MVLHRADADWGSLLGHRMAVMVDACRQVGVQKELAADEIR